MRRFAISRLDWIPAEHESEKFMDEALRLSDGHGFQGPHLDGIHVERADLSEQPTQAAPDGFVPLQLVMEPLGLRIEVARPDVVVGRHSQADVRLALLDISRRHCRIHFTEGQWRISDLSSLNGIFINGQRMQEATLYNGDQLQLGHFTFLVEHAVPVAPTLVQNSDADVLKSIAEVMKDAA